MLTQMEIVAHFNRTYPDKTNEQYIRIKTCGLKKGYATEKQAINNTKGKVRIYKCPYCKLFHISTHKYGEKI